MPILDINTQCIHTVAVDSCGKVFADLFLLSRDRLLWHQVVASEWRPIGALSSRFNYCLSIFRLKFLL